MASFRTEVKRRLLSAPSNRHNEPLRETDLADMDGQVVWYTTEGQPESYGRVLITDEAGYTIRIITRQQSLIVYTNGQWQLTITIFRYPTSQTIERALRAEPTMPIAQIIESLARWKDTFYFDLLRRGCEEDAEALVDALTVLNLHPDNQPNEPLALDELSEMVGKWVWVQYHGNDPHFEGWAYIWNPLWCRYQGKDYPMNLGPGRLTFYRQPPKEEK